MVNGPKWIEMTVQLFGTWWQTTRGKSEIYTLLVLPLVGELVQKFGEATYANHLRSSLTLAMDLMTHTLYMFPCFDKYIK